MSGSSKKFNCPTPLVGSMRKQRAISGKFKKLVGIEIWVTGWLVGSFGRKMKVSGKYKKTRADT